MGYTLVKDAIEELKSANIRITPQRYAVLEYLIENQTHPTADEIYKSLEVKFPNMSVATVYNNLRLFTEIGFVQELNYGDASSRFDFTDVPHYHAICKKCGKIVNFEHSDLTEIEKAASKLTGFQIKDHRLEVYGLCEDCK
ncbi:MAG: transcriptional repressor [Lactobacillales bacterium]|jgi:Fur family peroxide stress response transcriptional regulator|nr:transcriptional repressor [Lactobacillales bacterium]